MRIYKISWKQAKMGETFSLHDKNERHPSSHFLKVSSDVNIIKNLNASRFVSRATANDRRKNEFDFKVLTIMCVKVNE